MSTSVPVKTILVVDLTHVPPNDPFATTILGDLRARLIPPTRVGGVPTAVRSKGPGYSLDIASSS
jgi:hypothetical protein